MDIEARIWSRFTLDAEAQSLGGHLVLTCLLCGKKVRHHRLRRNLSEHLVREHEEVSHQPPSSIHGEELKAFFDVIKRPPPDNSKRNVCKLCGRQVGLAGERAPLVEHIRSRHPQMRLSVDESTGAEGDIVVKEETNNEDEELDQMLMASFEAEMRRQLERPVGLSRESDLSTSAAEDEERLGLSFFSRGKETNPNESFRSDHPPSVSFQRRTTLFFDVVVAAKAAAIKSACKKRRWLNSCCGTVALAMDKVVLQSCSLLRDRVTHFDYELVVVDAAGGGGELKRQDLSSASPRPPLHKSSASLVRACPTRPCPRCGKIFVSSSGLRHHRKKSHGADKLFSCKLCPRRFWNNRILKEHRREIHEKRRRKCRVCGVGFRRGYSLIIHLFFVHGVSHRRGGVRGDRHPFPKLEQTPTSPRDFEFPVKKEEPNVRRDEPVKLEISKVKIHVESPQRCPFCVKEFPSYEDLKRHADSVHDARAAAAARKVAEEEAETDSFDCSACDAEFATDAELRRHFARRHPGLERIEFDWWTWDLEDADWVQHERPLVCHSRPSAPPVN